MIRRLLVAFLAFALLKSLGAQVCDTSLWIPNGPVKSVYLRDSMLYVGGNFSQVSPVTGHFVQLDLTTAAVTQPFPLIAGTVNTIAKDSIGRIYVGGNFNSVGNLPYRNLFRFDVNGNIDIAFHPDPDGEVFTLSVYSGNLWVGGNFQNIAGDPRGSGASFFVTQNNQPANDSLTPFDPRANGTIYSMCVDNSGNFVVAAGNFSGIGGCIATYVGKLFASNGNYAPLGNSFWQCIPNPNAPARSVAISDSNDIYVGGDFTTFGTIQQKGLVRININSGNVAPVNPNLNGTVRSVLLLNHKLYIGGHFSLINGQFRNNLACVDLNLAVQPWTADASGDVYSISSWNDVLCVGGAFHTVNTDTAYYAALVDTANGTVRNWNAKFDAPVYAMLAANANGFLYAGGAFTGAGGVLRDNFCAINVNTRRPSSWAPSFNSTVQTIYADSSLLYVAGDFILADAAMRQRIAAFDLATGSLTSFNPGVDGLVRTMASDQSKLYLGGNFTTAGGQARNNIACIDIATSQATLWNPDCAGTVNKIILSGDHLYVGGFFGQIGGQFRDNTARLSRATGLADWDWSCNTDDGVYAMEMFNGTLYLGGWFEHVEGQPRLHLAAADTLSGAVASFDPSTNGYVRTMTRWNDDLFIGGSFSNVGSSLAYNHLCNYDIGDGMYDSWSPQPDATPVTLQASQDWLYAGGSFINAGFHFHPNLAMMNISYVTGVPEEQGQAVMPLHCWPNPATEHVYFSLPAFPRSGCRIKVVDVAGRTVREETTNSSACELDVSGLAPGLYAVIADGDGQWMASCRFVKQ